MTTGTSINVITFYFIMLYLENIFIGIKILNIFLSNKQQMVFIDQTICDKV